MKRRTRVTVKVESPDGERWERSCQLEADEWELIRNLVKEMNENPVIGQRKKPWNPADEIAIGFIRAGIRKMKEEGR